LVAELLLDTPMLQEIAKKVATPNQQRTASLELAVSLQAPG
jgi:hypothetical protein